MKKVFQDGVSYLDITVDPDDCMKVIITVAAEDSKKPGSVTMISVDMATEEFRKMVLETIGD